MTHTPSALTSRSEAVAARVPCAGTMRYCCASLAARSARASACRARTLHAPSRCISRARDTDLVSSMREGCMYTYGILQPSSLEESQTPLEENIES